MVGINIANARQFFTILWRIIAKKTRTAIPTGKAGWNRAQIMFKPIFWIFVFCLLYHFRILYKPAPNAFASANFAGVLLVELSAVTMPLSAMPIYEIMSLYCEIAPV